MTASRQDAFGGREALRRYTYVPALRIGNLVWISGTTATDDNNNIVGNDIVEQTRHIFQRFETLLNELGGTCGDIVETTDYFITMDKYRDTAAVRREIFGDRRPTSTGVMVAGLLRPGALIEISATALIQDKTA